MLVNSAGQRLCAQFHAENWIGAILWCNISFGLVARLVNMFLLEGTSFKIRIVCAGTGTLIGLGGIVSSILLGHNFFWLCLLAIIFVGTASSFGESVALCYLKLFPSQLVGAWSSGTGFAGVGGTLIFAFFILPGINMTNQAIFAIVSPLVLIYLAIFFFVIKPMPTADLQAVAAGESEKEPLVQKLPEASEKPAKDLPEVPPSESPVDPSKQAKPKIHPVRRFVRALKVVWFLAMNLILVYFFEYVACTGGSDRAQGGDWKHHSSWFVRNCYVILNFCYQLGVVISRSSLSIVKIKHVEVMTILQGINMVLWILQATFHWINGSPQIWILFIHMVYVGLLGGGAYVNIFYLALHKPDIPDEDRELGINIVALSNTIGITLSAVVIIIFDHTFWALPEASSSL